MLENDGCLFGTPEVKWNLGTELLRLLWLRSLLMSTYDVEEEEGLALVWRVFLEKEGTFLRRLRFECPCRLWLLAIEPPLLPVRPLRCWFHRRRTEVLWFQVVKPCL